MSETLKEKLWLAAIILLVIAISYLHYTTSTMKWQYHLVYMQAYFIPILMAAFQYGVRGGLGVSLLVSIIYLPHVMLQWGGLVENNLMRFLQIVLFNVVGYLTGLKAQGEREEKWRYREAVEELRKTLEQVKQQSERLSEMEQQLRLADRLAIVGELTASLAHEVRNPLGAIRGAVEILRDSVPEDVKKSEFFDILIEETDRLGAVVENYLRPMRLSGTRHSLYDVNETVLNLGLMLDSPARKKHIRLETLLPERPFWLRGDPNDLWQVLMNVALNALQAVDANGHITISLTETKANGARLTVQDNGPGIPEADQPHIFEALYTTRKNGTGLGLAIVKRIADENGWRIEVDSKAGSGTA
ncbi:MAG: sensor histidine kinase, partial [Calditrichaeota bacterium]